MAFMGIKYLEESMMNLIRMAWIDFRINALVEENKGWSVWMKGFWGHTATYLHSLPQGGNIWNLKDQSNSRAGHVMLYT